MFIQKHLLVVDDNIGVQRLLKICARAGPALSWSTGFPPSGNR